MQNNVNTNVERIIAKLDNDFNVDNSDWIPRVGAWCIDAMSQIDALRDVRKTIKMRVIDCFAYAPYPINSPNLVITDCNGCEINKYKSNGDCGCDSSTGRPQKLYDLTPSTIDGIVNNCATNAPNQIAYTNPASNLTSRYDVRASKFNPQAARHYVLIDDNKLELNFDADFVFATTDAIETYYSEYYQQDLPVIPNVGILIEAIAFYCLYKMLSRGYKHEVFNLGASQYGTNPYYEWKTLKDKAKTAVIIDAQGNILKTDGNMFQSSFFMLTVKPKN